MIERSDGVVSWLLTQNSNGVSVIFKDVETKICSVSEITIRSVLQSNAQMAVPLNTTPNCGTTISQPPRFSDFKKAFVEETTGAGTL